MLNDYDDVLSVAELAQALRISKSMAYQLVNSSVVGSLRVGKKILIPKACVADYLNSARYGVNRR